MNDIVQRLRHYLCIKSVQPTPDYQGCIDYLQMIGKELGLEMQVYMNNTKPLLVMTRKGTNPSLPSLLLTSHMDVVPVTEVHMRCPFLNPRTNGVVIHLKLKSGNGVIYSRGVQDMKSVGMAYLEALQTFTSTCSNHSLVICSR